MASIPAAEAPKGSDSKLDLHDLCRLKSKPSLVGSVEVSKHSELLYPTWSNSVILEDSSRSNLPKPPRGYVYITFAEPSQGSSLVHEDDLDLVDRAIGTGEIVKRDLNDTFSGTAIEATITCTLEPVAFRTTDPVTGEDGPLRFTEPAVKRRNSPEIQDDHLAPPLLYDIPVTELTNYEEFSEGDYIVYEQKLGMVREVERDAILLLHDQKPVSPLDPFALQLPISVGTERVVSWPENQSAMRSYPLPNGDYLWTVESESVFPGQYTLTSPTNLSRRDWSSDLASNFQPEGHILATPAVSFHVDWLCPNPFSTGPPHSDSNNDVLRASVLQGKAMRCDFSRFPTEGLNEKTVRSDTWAELNPGDRVRFRNPTDATSKYNHKQIPTDQSFGHDINIFRVVSTQTQVTVQWQDLSITTQPATSLHKFTTFGDEVWPGNIVILAESLAGPQTSCSRHEIRRAQKVGIVQAVNSAERVASVRWYKNPDVELLHRGNMLKPGFTLGELDETVTQVSVYELCSFPALSKGPGDLVLLAPETVHQSSLPPKGIEPPGITGPCLSSYLYPISFLEIGMYLESMKLTLVESSGFKNGTTIDTAPLPPRGTLQDDYNRQSTCNFVGNILSMDINGTVTVRLVGRNACRDICVPMEKILMVIDEDYDEVPPLPIPPVGGITNFPGLAPLFPGYMFDLPGVPPWAMDPLFTGPGLPAWAQTPSLFNRTYEYEGGERLDNDANDDQWMTEDDSEGDEESSFEEDSDLESEEHAVLGQEELVAPEVTEVKITSVPGDDQKMAVDNPHSHTQETHGAGGPSSRSSSFPSECPPGFMILESDPPVDHHFLARAPARGTGLRMSRIRKEYEILQSALPSGIFVRTWESRMDLLRVLIIGPQGTPYEHAPFVIDFQFPEDYPNKPPVSFFHSWTNGQSRVNPNLYEDGRICLSILGTWPTKNPEESWSPTSSTALQILVSIMGLVLVKNPFYNEAGYEMLAADDNRHVESVQYTEKAYLTARNFIKHAIEHSVAGLEDVVTWNYLAGLGQEDDKSSYPRLLRRAIDSALELIEHHNNTSAEDKLDEGHAAAPFVSRLSLGAVVMLRRQAASTGRAGCQNKECKDEKIKIGKGELRLGTWVDTERFQSFFWRHWGCVTPKIIGNLNESVEEMSGDAKDLNTLDGFEDLPSEYQEKVRKALEQGHVDDEDWKGDVEMNRPGKTGFRKRATKKKADEEEVFTPSMTVFLFSVLTPNKQEETASEKEKQKAPKTKKRARAETENEKTDDNAPTPKAKRAKKGGRVKQESDHEDEHGSDDTEVEYKPRPTRRGRSGKIAAEEKPAPAPEKPAAKRQRKSVGEDGDAEAEPVQEKPKRGRRKKMA
ncbi:putative ubiquitin-conjugating enzyme [Aspergillus clavatus NRRL 1]|uniref:Ubiquitin-conjugating enzyme, putative n=1 Tax=Aspergillus clavatus (strain ATCC 1007 / CBS 513.65 / DSM 816 / NCTC 3887 / NRRL 1 / QM 1276 / 107) TaxID=344612 RepID=A1CL39_ASPCL|nr:ubiquitin-conjugating enzyme, putative [Aspergillus clavatus NRRL 1]EAW09863.1 ubiquitin-conjugating enzyme, putative [Aspergillus clavatus NRRL 1]